MLIFLPFIRHKRNATHINQHCRKIYFSLAQINKLIKIIGILFKELTIIKGTIMQLKKWVSPLLISFCLFTSTSALSEDVVINKIGGEKEQLIADILTLVLSKSDPSLTVRPTTDELPQSRLVDAIKLGNADVMWAGADPRLEKDLKTVRIPLLKGLLGHRIFIIKKDQQYRFNDIKTFDDLKAFSAGQGTQWGDTQILKNAGVPVITTLKYPNLFFMLEGDRFDYFPRAIHEPWSEVADRPELNLAVEENIMLVYPFAMYFFVNKDNQDLHDKLYSGFVKAIEDGSFDQLFFKNQLIKDALDKTNLKHRTVIKIDNPAMHPDTPVDRLDFWLDPTSL